MATIRRQNAVPSGSNRAARVVPPVGVALDASSKANLAPKLLAAKRRKTTKLSAGKVDAVEIQSHSSKGRPDLSFIARIPLDIIFEILCHISLNDLIKVGRANQSWRRILIGAQAASVWRTARRAGGYPEPPDDLSEQRWANMLLGRACQSCGSTKLTWAWRDWLLLRVVCPACRRKHLVDECTITGRRFSAVNKDVLKYVPHTDRSGWDRHRFDRFYWDEDIIRLSSEYDAIEDPEIRSAWASKRIAGLENRIEMVPKYEEWQREMWKADRMQEQRNREARLEAIKARFLNVGFARNDLDMSLVAWLPNITSGSPNISNAAWAQIRPKLQARVQRHVNVRLAADLKPSIDQRMEVLERVYATYSDSLSPAEQLCCPPVEVLRPVPDILRFLESPKEVEITLENFWALKQNFRAYVADFHAKLKESLNGEAKRHDYPSFDLASVVFQRRKARVPHRGFNSGWTTPDTMVIVGWPMIKAHWTSHQSYEQLRDGVSIPMPAGFDINSHASLLSAKLVGLAGLDSKTASVTEMDARDPRAALSLLDAFRGPNMESDESFRLATPEEELQAKAGEVSLRALAKAWSCNHCYDFLEASRAESRAFIVEHLGSCHGVTEAKEPKDYFMNERCRHTYETPFEMSVPDRREELYQCLCYKCRQVVAEKRRFTWTGLEDHFSWIALRWPVLGVHYSPCRRTQHLVEA